MAEAMGRAGSGGRRLGTLTSRATWSRWIRCGLAPGGWKGLAFCSWGVVTAVLVAAGGSWQPAMARGRSPVGPTSVAAGAADGPHAAVLLAAAARFSGPAASSGYARGPAVLAGSIEAQAQAPGQGPPAAAGNADAPIQALVERVKAAAAAVRSRGEAVFPAFRERGGPWYQGDDYVVVLGSEGRSVVYPPDPRGEGLNYANFQDLGGKPFGRQLLAIASAPSGKGWVHYQWRRPKPGERRPVWKATYGERVTAPSGRTYVVLFGLYEPPMARAFVLDAVEGAAALLQRQGRAGFEALRDRRGPFFYQDTYVFVLDRQGNLLLNPGFPALEGRNLLSWPDPAERARAAASLKAVLEEGSTWTTYRWPRPSASPLPEAKITYLRKVLAPGGEVLIVGSGLYGEE